jgi:hypothetical protein
LTQCFESLSNWLEGWTIHDGTIVEAYAIKELKVTSTRLSCLGSTLLAAKDAVEVVELMGESFTEWLNWYAIAIGPFGIWAEAHIVQNRTAHTPATAGPEKTFFILSFDGCKNVW